MASQEEEVLAANGEFYRAFAARDARAMDAVWAKASPVVCIHPGWPALFGREQVMASWRSIMLGPGSPDIACGEEVAQVCGEAAFVVCIEQLPGAELIATNVFVREAAGWKMVHHHAGPVARAGEDDAEEPPSRLLN
jgi:ketosteroid isomerase-like protein